MSAFGNKVNKTSTTALVLFVLAHSGALFANNNDVSFWLESMTRTSVAATSKGSGFIEDMMKVMLSESSASTYIKAEPGASVFGI